MIAIDSEVAGLYFSHGCQTFAIGTYDGADFQAYTQSIDPTTRNRVKQFTPEHIEIIHNVLSTNNLCVFHNAHFDLKALAEVGVIDWSEPSHPEFWNNILDTTILSHVHHNTDPRSLKALSRLYLGQPYESEDRLNVIVNKCRALARTHRKTWQLAGKDIPQLKPSQSNPKWWKSDMWLPAAVANSFTKAELDKADLNYDELNTVMLSYLQDDCQSTYQLAQGLMAIVIEEHGDAAETYMKVHTQIQHITWKMEYAGIHVNRTELEHAVSVCEDWIAKLTLSTEATVGITDITDTKLRTILFDTFALPSVKETKSGKDSVDADTIIKLKEFCIGNLPALSLPNQFLAEILALRKYEKKLGYLKSYDNCSINNVVRPNFNIVGTDTLRISASNPSPQTVAKASNPFEDCFSDVNLLLKQSPPLRSVFGPAGGNWWISNDYSQLQLRIYAVLIGDEEMIAELNKGKDFHNLVACRIFGCVEPSEAQRRIAKNCNFGIIFGAQKKKIEQTAGIVGLYDTLMANFPQVAEVIANTKEDLKEFGFVRTLGGYPLDVPLQRNPYNGRMSKAAHAAVCYRVQGSEGEIVKKAMADCDAYLTSEFPEGRIAMQVHDELNFEMPARFPRKHAIALKHIMEEAAKFYGVTAPVDSKLITHRWDQGKHIAL